MEKSSLHMSTMKAHEGSTDCWLPSVFSWASTNANIIFLLCLLSVVSLNNNAAAYEEMNHWLPRRSQQKKSMTPRVARAIIVGLQAFATLNVFFNLQRFRGFEASVVATVVAVRCSASKSTAAAKSALAASQTLRRTASIAAWKSDPKIEAK